MKDQLKAFIDDLAKAEVSDSALNQYSYKDCRNSVRRDNLLLYLQQMAEEKPSVVLVGEAPSYRGARLTGVPFTSRYILLNGIERLGLFGKSRGYRVTAEFEDIKKEQSATIVWGTLAKLDVTPLIWNAFPFHPFKPGNNLSNRTPTRDELHAGGHFLYELIKLFDITSVIAVGNKAEESIKALGLEYTKVRHPAQGGKNRFIEGINECLSKSIGTDT